VECAIVANRTLQKERDLVMARRILVEPGSYGCHNMGDVAMMQVAVARLGELWPHARIEVVTSRPDLLSHFCPSAVPISAESRASWLLGRSLIGGLHKKIPVGISSILLKIERFFWLRCPVVTEYAVRLKAALQHRKIPPPAIFRKLITGADLLVLSGAGALNDAFADSALPLLDELEFALNVGLPVVAFGRGLGPLTEPVLVKKAQDVLPRFKLIGLREGRTALSLLVSFGVPKERIHVTGDDAIELAYRRHPDSLGNAIGINMRIADYAGTDDETAGKLREPLLRAVQRLNSFFVSVPISFHESDSDVKAARKLLGDEYLGSHAAVECPDDVIRQIGKCRVVVTGSYHAGVFALAQGVSVVALVHSPYYEQKFLGLQEQFRGGCQIIDLRLPVTSDDIQSVIYRAWEYSERVRDSLLEAAAQQIELSSATYRAAHSLFPTA